LLVKGDFKFHFTIQYFGSKKKAKKVVSVSTSSQYLVPGQDAKPIPQGGPCKVNFVFYKKSPLFLPCFFCISSPLLTYLETLIANMNSKFANFIMLYEQKILAFSP